MLRVSKAGSTWYAIFSASATSASPRGVPGAAFARADACAGAGPRLSSRRTLPLGADAPQGRPPHVSRHPAAGLIQLKQSVLVATWGSRSPSSTSTSSVCTSSSARFLRSMSIGQQLVRAHVPAKCGSLVCSRHEHSL